MVEKKFIVPTKLNLTVQSDQTFNDLASVTSGKTKYELFKHLEDLGFAEHKRSEEFKKDWETYVSEVDNAELEIPKLEENKSQALTKLDVKTSEATAIETEISILYIDYNTKATDLTIAQSNLDAAQLVIPALEATFLSAQADYDLKSAEGSGYSEEEIATALQFLTDSQVAFDAGQADVATYTNEVNNLVANMFDIETTISSKNSSLEKTLAEIENININLEGIDADIKYFSEFIAKVSPKTYGNYVTWNVINGENGLNHLGIDTKQTFEKLRNDLGVGSEGSVASADWTLYVSLSDPKSAAKEVDELIAKIANVNADILDLNNSIDTETDVDKLKDLKIKLVATESNLYSLETSKKFAESRANSDFLPFNEKNKQAFFKVRSEVSSLIKFNNLEAADEIERLISANEIANLIDNSVAGSVTDSIREAMVKANEVNKANQFIYPKLVDVAVDTETGIITLNNLVYDASSVVYVNGIAYSEAMFEKTMAETEKGYPSRVSALTASGDILTAIQAGANVFVMGVTGEFNELKFENPVVAPNPKEEGKG